MMSMRSRLLAAFVACLGGLVLPGCGGGHPATTSATPAPAPSVRVCSGLTDQCRQVPLAQLRRAQVHPYHGCHVPDVSDYQGYLNWTRIVPYVCGAIDKAGEGNGFGGASYFTHNWTQQKALGLWHSGYWFVRGYAGCSTQANLIISRLRSVGYSSDRTAGEFQLDVEVPGANVGNLALCIDRYVYAAFHRHAGIYTGSGTWPGGSHGNLKLWQAEYGPVLHTFWNPVVAWQCTDGVYGCVTYVPGIGYDDVSIDRGITSELPSHGHTRCLHSPFPDTVGCQHVRRHYAAAQTHRNAVIRLLRKHNCTHTSGHHNCKVWYAERARDNAALHAAIKRYG